MRKLVLLVWFRDQATPPEGDPPRFSVHGESEEISALEGDGSRLPAPITFDTQVTVTGDTSFSEDGTMVFGSGAGRVRIATVGAGLLEPSPEQGLHRGSVIWRLEEGEGALQGATGLVTSNFTVRMETGEVSERQVLALYIP